MAGHRISRHRDPSNYVIGPIAQSRVRRGADCTLVVAANVSSLKSPWPTERSTLRVEVWGMPESHDAFRLPRWSLNREKRTIRIYRHPIERLTMLHRRDRWHKRVLIESVVFSAVADMLGTDPWQLAPDRFHPH
jgi:hypothetical protein